MAHAELQREQCAEALTFGIAHCCIGLAAIGADVALTGETTGAAVIGRGKGAAVGRAVGRREGRAVRGRGSGAAVGRAVGRRGKGTAVGRAVRGRGNGPTGAGSV
jgi:hypothetical protein